LQDQCTSRGVRCDSC